MTLREVQSPLEPRQRLGLRWPSTAFSPRQGRERLQLPRSRLEVSEPVVHHHLVVIERHNQLSTTGEIRFTATQKEPRHHLVAVHVQAFNRGGAEYLNQLIVGGYESLNLIHLVHRGQLTRLPLSGQAASGGFGFADVIRELF